MTVEERIRQIANADLDRRTIACLRIFELLPEFFESLRQECLRLYEKESPSRASDSKHVTNWVRPQGNVLQFSLLNGTGRYDDTSTDHNLSFRGKRFHDSANYPTLAAFVSRFPHCVNFRLNVLGPEASLPVHKEHVCFKAQSGAIGLRLRFHLPVATNQGAEIALDGRVYHFPEGQVIFFNQGCVHGARNRGQTDRAHLVWDMLLTAASAELMFGQGVPPFPGKRYTTPESTMAAIGVESPGEFARLQPLVYPPDVETATVIEPQ